MWSFYHERKQKGLSIPCILGLTASPTIKSDPESLVKIEETLDAICRTPRKHLAELRLKVNLPVLSHVHYQSSPPEALLTGSTRTIESLGRAFGSLKIETDPYVLDLASQNTEKSLRKLQQVRLNRKTWCQQQMKTLHATGLKICHELGPWAADHYISNVVSKFIKTAEDEGNFGVWDLSGAEKQYLAKALKNVEIADSGTDLGETIVSDKVTRLIESILSEANTPSGIIFVQERAVVAALAHILSIHPAVRDRLKVGTMIGNSTSPYRRSIGELIDVDMQKQMLSLFKDGVINLIVATSVLEEGIDVPVCNLVICFHKPPNLKSFVQRRGRARHEESKLILLLDAETDKLTEWQELEREMKARYEDEMRTLQEVLRIENTEEHDRREFRVESTGALLDMDNAVQHLYHFCTTLPANEYVDLQPEFICSEAGPSLVSARVILPLSVNEGVRTAQSRKSWMSEKNAIRDCAFEAYVALYRAGLVNENLLPLLKHDALLDGLTSSAVETRASMVVVNEQLNPWVEVAKAWKSVSDMQQFTIQLGDLEVHSYLPIKLPPIAPFTVYWDSNTGVSVSVHSETSTADMGAFPAVSQETLSMLDSAFGSRFTIQQKPPVMLFSWKGNSSLGDQAGRQRVSSSQASYLGLIRDTATNIPYLFKEWLVEQPSIEMVQKPYKDYADVPKDTPHLSLTRLSRRQDFLHKAPAPASPPSDKPYSVVLPTSRCTVDDSPFEHVWFAMMIPSIMHRCEVYLLAHLLNTTILRDVGIEDVGLIVTAISASSAREDTNYQRLEFFGDMTLKLCTSVQLVSKYPLWHEGYLSAQKDRLVANSRLSRAAVETGLDRFIVTKAFTGHRWRPWYIDDLLAQPTEASRTLSSKVLADVVEALIGAAMVDGGFPRALACLRVFLPELDWQPLEVRQVSLRGLAPDMALPTTLHLCEELVGHPFTKKALLIEAMTHASCNSSGGSLERLEFLGDGILDRIITTTLFGQDPPLSHFQMHVIRTALVNADFLGFVCMEWVTSEGRTDVVEGDPAGDDEARPAFVARSSRTPLPLWRFLRHHSPRLGAEQVATAKRHAALQDQIRAALATGTRYPWALLSGLQAPKAYSDAVESVLGAVWVDGGSWAACEAVLERLGVLPYLRRVVQDGVQALHPKEELGVLAGAEPVRYVVSSRIKSGGEEGGGGKGQGEFVCSVFVGEREVACVTSPSRGNVRTLAAAQAVEMLRRGEEEARDGSIVPL
jgi:dsRNA-specific ribonuclease